MAAIVCPFVRRRLEAACRQIRTAIPELPLPHAEAKVENDGRRAFARSAVSRTLTKVYNPRAAPQPVRKSSRK
jgi:hypothetical protein